MPRSIAAVAILATLVFASGAQSRTLASETQPTAFFNRFALDSNVAFPNVARTAQRHGFVVLQSWQHQLARQLKAASPNLKVLAYKNLSFVVCDDYSAGRYVPQGVRCGDAQTKHPEWFLTDASGARLNSTGYPWAWLMDVGSASYQEAWATSVIAEAKADGWDGVFMDDTNPTVRFHVDIGRVARYPTDAAWTAATRSMLAVVGPRIRGAGLLAVANLCCARLQPGVWKDWLQFLSGALDEMFTKWGNDPSTGYVWDWGADGWAAQLEQVREAEAQGKYFLGVAHSRADDTRAATYGLATMLLAAEGRSSFSLAQDYTNETWFPEYDRAARLGTALAPYSRLGPVYRRDFSGGTVVVNPSQSTVHVELGSPYAARRGQGVRSLVLAPTTGAILLATDESVPESSQAAAAQPVSASSPPSSPAVLPPALAAPSAPAGPSAKPRPTVRLAVVATRRGRRPVLRLRLYGRLVEAAPAAGRRVTIVRKTRNGWKRVGRVRTDTRGGFRLSRRLRVGSRIVRLRAVTAHSGGRVRSGVLTIRIRRR